MYQKNIKLLIQLHVLRQKNTHTHTSRYWKFQYLLFCEGENWILVIGPATWYLVAGMQQPNEKASYQA